MRIDSPFVESGKDQSMASGAELLIRDNGENQESESLQGVSMCATYGY